MRALEVVLPIPKRDVDFAKTMFVSLGDDKFPGCLPLPLLSNALFCACNDHDILLPSSYPFMTGRPRKARRTMAKVQQKKEDSINSTESKKHPRHSMTKHKPRPRETTTMPIKRTIRINQGRESPAAKPRTTWS